MSLGSATRAAVSAITNRDFLVPLVVAPERGHHVLLRDPPLSGLAVPSICRAGRQAVRLAQLGSTSVSLTRFTTGSA